MADVLRLLALLASLAVIAVGSASVLLVITIRRLYRAGRSRFDRVLAHPEIQGNRALSPHPVLAGRVTAWRLQLRALVPGPTRPIATLRLDLQRDAASAARAVEAGIAAGRPVEQLRGAAGRFVHAASDLGLDLDVISGEPDPAVRRAMLTEQADRVDAVRRGCAQLRRGVLLAGGPSHAALPRHLQDDLDDQIDRLRLTAEAYHHLSTEWAVSRSPHGSYGRTS